MSNKLWHVGVDKLMAWSPFRSDGGNWYVMAGAFVQPSKLVLADRNGVALPQPLLSCDFTQLPRMHEKWFIPQGSEVFWLDRSTVVTQELYSGRIQNVFVQFPNGPLGAISRQGYRGIFVHCADLVLRPCTVNNVRFIDEQSLWTFIHHFPDSNSKAIVKASMAYGT